MHVLQQGSWHENNVFAWLQQYIFTLHDLYVHTYIPGVSTSSPCNKSLRVKIVGWYLGFCQNQMGLRLTTSAMGTSLSESFIRDTWIRLPSWSI